MRTRKNTSKIILAVIVAILATMISFSAFNKMSKQIQEQGDLIKAMREIQNAKKDEYNYAVAASDLKSGEIVSDNDVDFKKFGVKKSLTFYNFPPTDL